MSRRSTLPAAWAALAAVCGGVGALAAICGVTPRTLRRWASDEIALTALRRRDVAARLRRRGLAMPAKNSD